MPVLLLHAAATWFMTGLIWFVQVVHYPLGSSVGHEAYPAYQARLMRLTTFVVGPPMLLEVATTALLLVQRPTEVPAWLAWTGAALLAAVWLSTALLQVPAHDRLTRGFDAEVHRRLVLGNQVRTVGWTARGVVAMGMLGFSG